MRSPCGNALPIKALFLLVPIPPGHHTISIMIIRNYFRRDIDNLRLNDKQKALWNPIMVILCLEYRLRIYFLDFLFEIIIHTTHSNFNIIIFTSYINALSLPRSSSVQIYGKNLMEGRL